MQGFNDFFYYHMRTKHSYLSIRTNPNRVDWNNQPSAFKSYPKNYERIELDLEKSNHGFIYHIAGISAKKTYPGVEYYLRVNPSAGALYPNEVYFQSRNNKDLKDGIYHFDIASSSITLLQELDNFGLEGYFNHEKEFDGFIFLISSIYYRSSWKYKNRAFRYCLLDAGHILGTVEASSYLYDKDYKIVYDFDKKNLNKLFGFDNREFFTSSVFIGNFTNKESKKIELSLPTVDGSFFFEENPIIEKAYIDSITMEEKKAENKSFHFSFEKSFFKDIVQRRRSIRGFDKQSISKAEFDVVLENLTQDIKSDCDEKLDIYCVINRVKDMKLGLLKVEDYLKDGSYLKTGDFMSKAGYLCLEQELGSFSSVTFFVTSKSKNYQALYQKAGLVGHRLYLISNYLGIGCSGIGAYYDDEVCEFISDYTQVLYALAIGK